MNAKHLVPLRIRNRLRGVLFRHRRPAPCPSDVVKANTRDAFDYFYRQDAFIEEQYLEPSRLELYAIVADHCVSSIENPRGSGKVRMVDIGCGTGEMLQRLISRMIPEYEIEAFGLDFAPSAIEKAERLLPEARFLVDDIYHNRLASDYFDLVVSLETMEHLEQPNKAIAEAVRVCKPDGVLVITVPNGEKDSWDGHVNFWNATQFKEFLMPYGTAEIKMLQDDTIIMATMRKPGNLV
jgi:SAM-dependent methyltransferase